MATFRKRNIQAFYVLMPDKPRFYLVGRLPREAYIAAPYDTTLKVIGGSGALAVDFLTGVLPPGLSIEVPASDPNAVRVFGSPISDGGGGDEVVINGILPDAISGRYYDARLTIVGATHPVTVDISEGVLPSWLTMEIDPLDESKIHIYGMAP